MRPRRGNAGVLSGHQAADGDARGLHKIYAASKALEDARRHLERAEHHFGGHRAKALELVKQAEAEVKEAVAYAKPTPPPAAKQ